MRVKGFRENSMEKLEKAINAWLEENCEIEVVQMQYDYNRGVSDVYSAMLLYKRTGD